MNIFGIDVEIERNATLTIFAPITKGRVSNITGYFENDVSDESLGKDELVMAQILQQKIDLGQAKLAEKIRVKSATPK